MEFIPAIDLIGGQCVRLKQGDFAKQTNYGDPLEAATEIESQGANWLHIVDLDAARSLESTNRDAIKDICRSVNLKIQVGGGIRSLDAAKDLFDIGVSKVVVGTMAITDPKLIEEICSHKMDGILVGLDYRRNAGKLEVAINGWLEGTGVDLFDVLPSLINLGASGVIATDISRDGMFGGPDLDTLDKLLAIAGPSGVGVIASGGIASLGDLAELKALVQDGQGLFGAISGRAVHDGRISVREAMDLCQA